MAELDHPLPLAWQRGTRCGRTGRGRAEVGYRLRAEKAARQRGTLDAHREPDRATVARGQLARDRC